MFICDKIALGGLMKEKCYFMFKPGFTDEETVCEVLRRLREEGADILEVKNMLLSEKACREHYAHIVNLKDKVTGEAVYPKLEEYMLSGPVIGVNIEGETGIIDRLRAAMGSTRNPAEGTLRNEFIAKKGIPEEDRTTKNGFHCSDSPENAEIEIDRFFGRSEELGIITLKERTK